MTRFFPILSLFFCFFATSLFAQVDIFESLVVKHIQVNVVNAAPGTVMQTNPIVARMKTKVGKVFSQVDFDDDLKTLAQDYADVDPVVDVVDGGIIVTLNVSLRPHIRSIQWCGNYSISSGKLIKELSVGVGNVFDRAEFNKALFEVRKFYVKRGYFEVDLDYCVEYDNVNNEVDILIEINEGRSGKIRSVKLINFTSEEESELQAMLVTQPWNFFYSYFSDIGTYSEEAMLQDQFVIVNFLQNQGYADAKVRIEPAPSQQTGRIVILITADKGEKYQFGEISIQGNEIISTEELECLIGIREGQTFSPSRLQNAINSVRDLYGNRGYIDAYVEFEPTLDMENPIYDIDFVIEEGEQYRVGLIRVLGNITTNTNVILHECLLTPGETFNLAKMKATEARLRNVGFFSCVNVYAVRSEDSVCLGENYRDVHIEVVETTTGNFSAFLGLSSFESVFGGLSVCEKNFNIKGLGSLLECGPGILRGGGEYAYFTTTIGARSLKYQSSWAKPYFMDTPWIFGVDFDRSWVRYISNDYSLNSWGIRVYGRYPLNGFMNYGVHYRIRNSDVDLSDPETAPFELKRAEMNKGLISAVGFHFCYDTTDHPLIPSKGIRSRFESEYAGLGGDHDFFSIGYLNSIYIPSGKYGVFKLRADAKFIIPAFGTKYANIPLDERLFLGGICSVRGYRDFSLGTRFKDSFNVKTDDPTGGISMNLASFEYVYRYWCKVEPFVFFDAGHLSNGVLSFGRLSTSAGFGIRAFIMPGSPPLTLGWGWPINNPDNAPSKTFFFSLGGNF